MGCIWIHKLIRHSRIPMGGVFPKRCAVSACPKYKKLINDMEVSWNRGTPIVIIHFSGLFPIKNHLFLKIAPWIWNPPDDQLEPHHSYTLDVRCGRSPWPNDDGIFGKLSIICTVYLFIHYSTYVCIWIWYQSFDILWLYMNYFEYMPWTQRSVFFHGFTQPKLQLS